MQVQSVVLALAQQVVGALFNQKTALDTDAQAPELSRDEDSAFFAGLADSAVGRQASAPVLARQNDRRDIRVTHTRSGSLDFRHLSIMSGIVASLHQQLAALTLDLIGHRSSELILKLDDDAGVDPDAVGK